MRATGPETRRLILESARRLFSQWGATGVSVADIATEADVFPSQITYYFGSKEALFVEAACRELLLVATEVERRGRRARTPEQWARATVRAALDGPGLMLFIEAMVLARHRADLTPIVARTLDHLHSEGERALQEKVEAGDWWISTTPAAEARAFWATVMGVAVQRAVTGEVVTRDTAEAAVRLVSNLHARTEGDQC